MDKFEGCRILSREEEYEAWKRGDEDLLVRSQMMYAWRISERLCRKYGYRDIELIYSAALHGLCRSVKTYDASTGFRLTTYATRLMFGESRRELFRQMRLGSNEINASELPDFVTRKVGHGEFDSVDIMDEFEKIRPALDCLSVRERSVLMDRVSGRRYRETGEEWGVSRERIRQIGEVAIGKVQSCLKSAGSD